MRIGLALPHYDFSLPGGGPIAFARVAEVAGRAERLGFDSVWMSDHFFASLERYGGDDVPQGSLEPLTTLAALAPMTERVRLGTLVLSAGFRHPAILAKSATAIDLFSGGRLDLGIGAGWYAPEFEAFGYPFGTTGERFGVLEETLEVLTRLFEEGPASYEGRRFALHDAFNHPLPAQRPRPPIWLGGKGGPRLLSLAARFADGWNTAWRWTPDAYGHRVTAARHACEEIGRDPATIRRTIQAPLFMTDDDAFRQRVIGGMSAATGRTPEEAARSLLIGSVEEIKAKVQEYVDAGVQEFMLALWPRFHRDSLLRFSEEVIPAFR